MRSSRLAPVLGLALAFAVSGIGCEDDVPAPKRDAGRIGGSDGGVDRPADTALRDAPAPIPDRAPDTPAPDAPTPDTAVPDAAIPDSSPDTAVDAPVSPDTSPDTSPDRMPNTPPPTPDTAVPPDMSGIIVVDTCAQVSCPGLFDLSNTCNGDNLTCRVNVTQVNPPARTTCFDDPAGPMNLVKKVANDTMMGTDNVTSIRVFRMDGSACYNLDVTQRMTGPEIWVFSTPAGVEVASATVVPSSGSTILTCTATGTVYDVSTAGCAGFEGEGAACTNDPTCVVP
jgi:hypothetical protein